MNRSKQLLRIARRIESLSRQAQPLARIVDQPEHESPGWLEAAAELRAVARECYTLALDTEDPDLIAAAFTALAEGPGSPEFERLLERPPAPFVTNRGDPTGSLVDIPRHLRARADRRVS
jgi:hypothetical protein